MITTNAGEAAEKFDHPYIAGGDVKWYRHSGKQVWQFHIKLYMQQSYGLGSTLLAIYLRVMTQLMLTQKPICACYS